MDETNNANPTPAADEIEDLSPAPASDEKAVTGGGIRALGPVDLLGGSWVTVHPIPKRELL
jgi:hypothetical protein